MIVPPHDSELERIIIKSIIDNPEARPKFFAKLHHTDLYDSKHQKNFESLRKAYMQCGDIDLTVVETILEYTDFQEYVSALFADQQIETLRDYSKKRQIMKLIDSMNLHLSKKDANWILTESSKALSKIKSSSESYTPEVKIIGGKAIEQWETQKGKELLGLKSGMKFDEIIYGYRPSHYWVIGAYTSYGKTTLACYLLAKLIKEYPLKPFAFFSVEMSQIEIFEKVATQYIGKGMWEIRNNYGEYKTQLDSIRNSELHIFDNKRTVEEIRLELQILKIKDKLPEVVFVDFIQNMWANYGSEYERITSITMDLQGLAKEFNICVVALSQINNEGAKTSSEVIPFKGSGAIAHSADMAVQILRKKEDELKQDLETIDLEIRVIKNRHGKTKRFYLDFNRNTSVISPSCITNQ